ncbi:MULTISPECIES: hypothetical protein [unclassified Janibacter]|uniref:hypothetical protein n=1 Tax=unclassified Janibacter TaxID=2649294 RepID=UPI003CFDA54F
MVLLGLLLVLAALVLGAVLVLGTQNLTDSIDLEAMNVTVSLNPLSLLIAGAVAMFLLWMGLSLIRSALARKNRLRRERRFTELDEQRQREIEEHRQRASEAERRFEEQRVATDEARRRAEVAERTGAPVAAERPVDPTVDPATRELPRTGRGEVGTDARGYGQDAPPAPRR